MPTVRPGFLSVFAALLALSPACSVHLGCYDTVRGSGVQAERTFHLGAFRRFEASGAVHATIAVDGEPRPARLVADDNLIDLFEATVVDGVLRLEARRSYSTENPVRFFVSTPSLEGLELSGACDAVVKGIDGARFEADLSGASSVEASGRVDELVVAVSGAAHADLTGLRARTGRVEASGSSDARVHVLDALRATASGVAHVRQFGPGEVNATVSGLARVKREQG